MTVKKLEWLQEQLDNIIDFAVIDSLKYSEGNPFENYEEEYDVIRSIMADYGEPGVPEFQDEFFRHHKAMLNVIDKDSKDYWLDEGNYERMFDKGNHDATFRFVTGEFTEFVIAEVDPEKKKFLAAIGKYLKKFAKGGFNE